MQLQTDIDISQPVHLICAALLQNTFQLKQILYYLENKEVADNKTAADSMENTIKQWLEFNTFLTEMFSEKSSINSGKEKDN